MMREQEKLGLRGGRKAGPLRRGLRVGVGTRSRRRIRTGIQVRVRASTKIGNTTCS